MATGRRRTGVLLILLGLLGIALAVERTVLGPHASLARPLAIAVASALAGAVGLLLVVWPDPHRRGRSRRPRTRPESAPAEAPPLPTPAGDEPVTQDQVEPTAAEPMDEVSAHWGLSRPAFDNSPNPRFLYRSAQHEAALGQLLHAVESRAECVTLTGPPGCGKTLVSRALLAQLDPARYEIALLVHPTLSGADVLREVLYQLGVDAAAASEAELSGQLSEVQRAHARDGRSTVVMVDEAQLIDEAALALLASLGPTLVLIGTSELEDRLPGVPDLARRIAARARLETLGPRETAEYVRHRLRVAGRRDMVFTEAALGSVFAASGGRPRMINNLCELSLLIGHVRGRSTIDADTVAAAIDETEGRGDA